MKIDPIKRTRIKRTRIKRIRTFAVVAAVVTAGAAAIMAASPQHALAQDVGLTVGSAARPATVQDLDGKSVDLAQYIGKKPVLVEFWATWCPICAELAPRLDAAAKKYAGKVDVVVIAVGVNENARSIKRHLEKHAPPGRVLFDSDGSATRAFDAPSTSYVVVLDKKGKVVYTGTGSDQNIDAAMTKAIATK